jgi:hypothetical protein
MARKKFYMNSGFILVGDPSYPVPHTDIEVSSSRVFEYEDEYGDVFQYDYPMFEIELQCSLECGYMHIVILADENRLINFKQGCNAEGDGDNWDLENLDYSYGRDPYINNLFNPKGYF